ncbi:hypothetical protein ACVDG3_19975 [Meridianimarinicoccus sp. RP-17]|uniref:hypothetical protein n=1 Tax=Meridianimarinicoccus zhengii TaxID=2056810 RepID=UPI001F29BD34|nr:hypothetical protein [Phycocomes zhengii]
MRAGAWAVLAVLHAAGASAADTGDGALTALRRTLEMPFHEALLAVIVDPDTTLAPFTTDGCSGGLSAAWDVAANLFPEFAAAHDGRPPWEDCCIDHDRRYHDAGGATEAAQSHDARLAADEDLRRCVVAAGNMRAGALADYYGVTEAQVRLAYGAVSDAMFNAVRFGGAPCSGLPWRWGYGYPGCFVLSE